MGWSCIAFSGCPFSKIIRQLTPHAHWILPVYWGVGGVKHSIFERFLQPKRVKSSQNCDLQSQIPPWTIQHPAINQTTACDTSFDVSTSGGFEITFCFTCFCNHIIHFPIGFIRILSLQDIQLFTPPQLHPTPVEWTGENQWTWKLIVLRMVGLNKALLRLKHISIQVLRQGVVNLITSYPSPI